MIRIKFGPHHVEAAQDAYNRATLKYPPGTLSHLQILPNGGRAFTITPTIH